MKFLILALALSAVSAHQLELEPSCEKPLYCNSKLLHYVQMARIFPESKTFVDLHMKNDEKYILNAFDLLLKKTNDQPSKQQLQLFVSENFESFNELENWTPDDFVSEPSFLANIKDIEMRSFARNIHNIWPVLGRKVKPIVHEKPENFSMIPVQNGFIIPGLKLNELYYWDTYWIVEGLLVSGMKDTVKGMLSNLVDLQRTFGHIPNGNRWYFQRRSQPPLLSAMVMKYLEATHDTEFLKSIIDALESELQYWIDTHSVIFKKDGKEYTLLRYFTPSKGPRPEWYYEDYTQAQNFDSEERQQQYYNDIKSAAESGWDFSSRWFINQNGTNIGDLTSTHASHIAPVDLNSIFTRSMQNMAYYYSLLHNSRKGAHWAHIAKQWRNSIKEVMWNDEDGVWYDWDLSNNIQRKYFYPSNIAPLWMEVVDVEFINERAPAILAYMKKTHSLEFPGGVPTSFSRTGQKWDYPYAWAPLVSMVVKSLEALKTEESEKLAYDVVKNWVRSNLLGYTAYKQLFGNYDVERGSGYKEEEYAIQAGFGWTSGATLQMLAKYGHVLKSQDDYYNFHTYKSNPIFWHIPTSAYLPSYYKSSKTAPVLTELSPFSEFVSTFTSTHNNESAVSGQVESITPSPTIHITSEEPALIPPIPTKPELIPSAEVKPWVIYSTTHQPELIPLVPAKLIPSVEIKPEIIPSTAFKPEPVTFVPVKPELVSTAEVKPQLVPSTEVKPQLIPSVVVKSEQIPPPVVKPELIPSVVGTPELIPSTIFNPQPLPSAVVKPEVVPSVVVKPELIPSVVVKPEFIPAKPQPVPAPEVKPELIPSVVGTPELIPSTIFNPQPLPSAVVKPEVVPSVVVKPELIPSVVVKPEFIPAKPQPVPSPEVKPEQIPSVVKPELIPSAVVKPELIPSAVVRPELHSSVIVKPERFPSAEEKPYVIHPVTLQLEPLIPVKLIPSAQYKPELIPSTNFKPDLVTLHPIKSELVSTAEVKPHLVPSTEVKPELSPSIVVKPELTPSAIVKPELIPSVVATPELIPSAALKPQPLPSAVVKPEVVPSVAVKPDLIPSVVVKPELIPAAAFKPQIIPSGEVKPWVIHSTTLQPELISLVPAKLLPSEEIKPELIPSYTFKPELVTLHPIKPELISSAEVKPQLVSSTEVKPQLVPSVEVKPGVNPAVVIRPELIPSVQVKPELIPSAPVKPELISSVVATPEPIPSTVLKPHPLPSAVVKPELTPSVTLPELVTLHPIKPELISSAEVKPQLVSSTEVKPQLVPSVEVKPGVNPAVVIRPELIPSVQVKPELIPSAPVKPELIPSVVVKPVQNPAAELNPTVVVKPELIPVKPVKHEQISSGISFSHHAQNEHSTGLVQDLNVHQSVQVEYKPVQAEKVSTLTQTEIVGGALSGAVTTTSGNFASGQAQWEQNTSQQSSIPLTGFSVDYKPVETEKASLSLGQAGNLGEAIYVTEFSGAAYNSNSASGQAQLQQTSPLNSLSVGYKPIESEKVSLSLGQAENLGGAIYGTGLSGAAYNSNSASGQAQLQQTSPLTSFSVGYKPIETEKATLTQTGNVSGALSGGFPATVINTASNTLSGHASASHETKPNYKPTIFSF